MKKFFGGILVFFLVLIIVGGLSYIGSNLIRTNQTGGTTTVQPIPTTNNQTNTNIQTQDNIKQDPTVDSMKSHTQEVMVSTVISQLPTILKNKEKLDQARVDLDDALEYMTLDPYAPTDREPAMDMGSMQPSDSPSLTRTPESAVTANPTTTMTDTSMQSMGTVYDAVKMEKLHSGLFKLAMGMELLEQLSNELISQAEVASASTQNPIQDYTNQYNLSTKNQTNLSQAMGYLVEAATLVNINPYISPNGLVYDQERMGQIHQSLIKLAEGVAKINLLNSDLTNQSIYLANTVQLYVNNANAVNAANAAATAAQVAASAAIIASDTAPAIDTTNVDGTTIASIFDNTSISRVVNIILIVFVLGLILGIIGFVFSLFKAPVKTSDKT